MLPPIFFVIGQALHALAQIDAIARSKNNPTDSRLTLFLARWIPIVCRAALCFALFELWLQGELADTLIALEVHLPAWGARVLDLHVGSAVAFLAGLAFDSVIGYIPIFKSSVPPPIGENQEDSYGK